MKKKNYKIDMCNGPLFIKIILFAMPLLATYIIQLLFNAADLIIVGQYAHYNAMAAVGSTMNFNGLVINVFIGLSVGTNVVVARLFGAKDSEGIRKAVHTSMAISLYGGIVLMVVGLIIAKDVLIVMQTPKEILPLSCTYIWICFCAIPFIMFYNFGCAILRAAGDTIRPLIILVIAGIVNVLLNLLFIVVFKMGVAGVALATAASHILAAVQIMRILVKSKDEYALNLRKLGVDKKIFLDILKIGVPAGVQSSGFALSNMIIQSSINSFGALAMAGMTAAISVEGIVYISSFAFHQTAISFVSQNLGGGKFHRILKSVYICLICAVFASIIIGWSFFAFGDSVLAIFNPNEEVIKWGVLRMKILFTTYMFCAVMDVSSGALRGLGYSLTSAIISLFGICALRVVWVYWVFPYKPTMQFLLLSYPITWIIGGALGSIILYFAYNKILKKHNQTITPWFGLQPIVLRGLKYIGYSR